MNISAIGTQPVDPPFVVSIRPLVSVPTAFCPGLKRACEGWSSGWRAANSLSYPGACLTLPSRAETTSAKLTPEGELEGTLQVAFSGQEALSRRLESYDEDETGRRNTLEDEIKEWLPTGANVEIKKAEPWESSDEDFRVECTFTVPNFATVSGHRMLFPLAIFQSPRTNPFKSEKRKYPIYFDYAYQVEDKITWTLPDGFQVEGLPSGYSYQNNYINYKTSIAPAGAGLIFQRSKSMNGFIFDAGSYTIIKAAFEQMISNDNKQVVLRHSEPKS